MKPRTVYKLAATRESIEKTLGPKIAEMFVQNPKVDKYDAVLCFPDTKVILSGEIDRALRKLGARPGPFLIVAKDLTVEARKRAASAGCDVLTRSEFGWTDDSYRRIRQNHPN